VIFKNSENIDDNLLDLAKKFRKLIKKKPIVQWHKERDLWVIGAEDYLSYPVYISYHWIDKNKYEAFMDSHVFGTFRTAKEAVDAVNLLKFMEEGIPSEVIQFLANRVKNPYVSMKEAVNLIPKECDTSISVDQMWILGIDPNQRGSVAAKRFGV
jgi:hypothetical protein